MRISSMSILAALGLTAPELCLYAQGEMMLEGVETRHTQAPLSLIMTFLGDSDYYIGC